MEFDNNKPIYLQIADNICDRILKAEFKAGERIPSVREWGAGIGVNPNTVAHSYEILTDKGIIYNQRGIGFFVTGTATELILNEQRKSFIENELPAFIKRAELLGINIKNHIS